MRRCSVVTAAGLVVALGAPHSLAQGEGEYLVPLDRYARGEATEAVAALAAWPEMRVRDALRTLEAQAARDEQAGLEPRLDRRARTAVMLHTETAFAEAADRRESFHVEVARSFVRRLLDSPQRVNPSTRDFVARWHALAAMLYCVRNDAARARAVVNDGLAFDAKHKQVNLIAGALLEYQIAQEEPNLRGDWNVDLQRDYILRKLLHQAAQTFRVIVSNYPDFLEARLRLGWVLSLNDSLPSAQEQLAVVAAQSRDRDLLYLAHMFLASLHERANRPADAAREYEAARVVAPFQSSLIALIRIAATLGQDDRVRSLVNELPVMAAAGHYDPWSFYDRCWTGGNLIEGLRVEARRP